MKKILPALPIVLCSVFLLSWGVLGHRTVAKIAGMHLTPNARAAVEYYLGNQTMSDVSTYPDEILREEQYRYTAPWHYINVTLGYDYGQFSAAVHNLQGDNVYTALQKCENDLRDHSKTKDEKAFALKFVIHLVGDLHQPMHVSRAEDKGGNTIKVTFNGQDANLHSLWDTRLIEHQELNYEQLAVKYDHATPEQIRQWQSDDLMKWLFESYQFSARIYADASKSTDFDEAYYQAHLPVIQQRIEQAGIRLAGVLNSIFTHPPPHADAATSAGAIDSHNPATPATSTAASPTVCDSVYSTRYFDGSQMTLLNLGGAYPDQKLTIMIRGADRAKFKTAPETAFANKRICVTGVEQDYKGKPEIIVTDPGQIVMANK
jgi:hypothetical protein